MFARYCDLANTSREQNKEDYGTGSNNSSVRRIEVMERPVAAAINSDGGCRFSSSFLFPLSRSLFPPGVELQTWTATLKLYRAVWTATMMVDCWWRWTVTAVNCNSAWPVFFFVFQVQDLPKTKKLMGKSDSDITWCRIKKQGFFMTLTNWRIPWILRFAETLRESLLFYNLWVLNYLWLFMLFLWFQNISYTIVKVVLKK